METVSQKQRVIELLRGLIAGSLGEERVADLLNSVEVAEFPAYIMKNSQAVVPKADYSPRTYSRRSGVPYFRPDGWIQVWISAVDQDPDFSRLSQWPVAYYGTDSRNIGPILEAGLRKPGQLPSEQMAHGNVGAGVEGAVYASPSLWLASHPVHSTLLELTPKKWIQLLFKLRVRPWSYKVQPSILSNSKHWERGLQLDPNFEDNEGLEWLISESEDAVVVGLMLRELGEDADLNVFGGVAGKVRACQETGVEYCWISLLKDALRSGSYFLSNALVNLGRLSAEWHVSSLPQAWKAYVAGRAIESRDFSLPAGRIERCHLSLCKDEEDAGKSVSSRMRLAVTLEHQASLWCEISIGDWRAEAIDLDGTLQDKYLLPSYVTQNMDELTVHLRVIPVDIPIDLVVKRTGAAWRLDAKKMRLSERPNLARRLGGKKMRLEESGLSIWSPDFSMFSGSVEVAFKMKAYVHDSHFVVHGFGCSESDDSDEEDRQFTFELAVSGKTSRATCSLAGMGCPLWVPIDQAIVDDQVLVSVKVSDAQSDSESD